MTVTRFLVIGLVLARAACSAAEVSAETLRAELGKSQLRFFIQRGAEAAIDGDLDQAAARLRIAAAAWAESPPPAIGTAVGDAHSRKTVRSTFAFDFFSWRDYFRTARRLDAAGRLDPELRAASEAIAREVIRPMERGPNNRSYHFALGAIHAATLFPAAPDAAKWRAYAEAVWQDWWTLGDGYEPGYVAHHLPQIIELGEALGHESELRSPRALATFHNFRDHVSPAGHAEAPADPGGPGDESDYIEGLAEAARVTRDGSLLAAAQRALAASPAKTPGRARLEKFVAAAVATGVTPVPAAPLATVQHLYPATYRQPDRLILSLADSPPRPYAALYLNDKTETLFHGHEDHRGDVYHYEVDGVVYLRGSGWEKWVGYANTFVVADARADFPEALAHGLERNHWYAASADVRSLRYYQPGENWVRGEDSATDQYQTAFLAPDGLGYAWANPHGLAGEHDEIALESVTLRFLAIPTEEARRAEKARDHLLNTLSFDPAMFWYRDYRTVAATDGPLEMRVTDPRLTGPAGEVRLADFSQLPDDLRVTHYAPGTRGQPGRVLAQSEWTQLLRFEPATATTRAALRVTCPPGRLDVELSVPKRRVQLTRDFPRLDFAYEILSPTDGLFRAPLGVAINGQRPRSVYVDGQQGGMLASSDAQIRDGDAGGSIRYDGVFATGARWTRHTVLTREGVLVVLDTYAAAPGQLDATGGPVWHPLSGRPLGIYFHRQPGDTVGEQVQPKFAADPGRAMFNRRALAQSREEYFLSVLVPGAAADALAPFTELTPEGLATVKLAAATVILSSDGTWSVRRTP